MSGQSYILLIISVTSNEDLFDSIRLPLYIHITMMLLVGLIIHPHILNKPRNIFQDSSIIGVPLKYFELGLDGFTVWICLRGLPLVNES